MTNFSKLTFLSYQLFPILHTDWFFLFLVIIFFYPLLYKSSKFLSGMKPCGRRIATMAENLKRKTDTYTNTCEYAVIFFFFFLFVAIKIPVAKSTFFFSAAAISGIFLLYYEEEERRKSMDFLIISSLLKCTRCNSMEKPDKTQETQFSIGVSNPVLQNHMNRN